MNDWGSLVTAVIAFLTAVAGFLRNRSNAKDTVYKVEIVNGKVDNVSDKVDGLTEVVKSNGFHVPPADEAA